jgi:hypothetical protein
MSSSKVALVNDGFVNNRAVANNTKSTTVNKSKQQQQSDETTLNHKNNTSSFNSLNNAKSEIEEDQQQNGSKLVVPQPFRFGQFKSSSHNSLEDNNSVRIDSPRGLNKKPNQSKSESNHMKMSREQLPNVLVNGDDVDDAVISSNRGMNELRRTSSPNNLSKSQSEQKRGSFSRKLEFSTYGDKNSEHNNTLKDDDADDELLFGENDGYSSDDTVDLIAEAEDYVRAEIGMIQNVKQFLNEPRYHNKDKPPRASAISRMMKLRSALSRTDEAEEDQGSVNLLNQDPPPPYSVFSRYFTYFIQSATKFF